MTAPADGWWIDEDLLVSILERSAKVEIERQLSLQVVGNGTVTINDWSFDVAAIDWTKLNVEGEPVHMFTRGE